MSPKEVCRVHTRSQGMARELLIGWRPTNQGAEPGPRSYRCSDQNRTGSVGQRRVLWSSSRRNRPGPQAEDHVLQGPGPPSPSESRSPQSFRVQVQVQLYLHWTTQTPGPPALCRQQHRLAQGFMSVHVVLRHGTKEQRSPSPHCHTLKLYGHHERDWGPSGVPGSGLQPQVLEVRGQDSSLRS
ncbi:hypothetical protein EYF80_059762 [Liparis tanakae]|uniref:Uncharacterized protein n=1 Tax=Liparis tanakae TaxID=230148 RepID=A0A4Z2EMB1_9TELE|nr:hypothetical protein EYF80_059762 [Liparis tanakae]